MPCNKTDLDCEDPCPCVQGDDALPDSGERVTFGSGMVRDVTTGKINVALVYDGPMLERWALHLTRGAAKYEKRNWMQASGDEELERFLESAARHFTQWMMGDYSEDHAAAVFFNINGAEYVRQRLAEFKRPRQ